SVTLTTSATRTITQRITRNPARAIHSGDRTQIHGQVILPSSLSVMKISVSSPVKPIPPRLDDLLSAISVLLVKRFEPLVCTGVPASSRRTTRGQEAQRR